MVNETNGMPSASVLEARGISKTFPGVRALDGVDFTLCPGEIHALMGENGAGKSTLIKVLTGDYRPDAGSVTLAGRPFTPGSPLEAQHLGVSAVHQEVNLIPNLSVAENICLGREPTRFGFVNWGAMRLRAEAALARLDVRVDVTRWLSNYSVAIQQMVAIARALDVQARVLVLDEPTSSLDAQEVAALFTVLRRLKGEGLAILFVSHFLDQVYAVADRFTVLRNGKLVGEHLAADLPRLELVGEMIGKNADEAAALTTRRGAPPTDQEHRTLLRAQGIGRRGALEPLDLELRTGEVLGLAGLLGSGRTETAKLLFGVDPAQTGSVQIEEVTVDLRSPRAAIAHRLGFCPEERKTEGIIPNLSVRENIVLALQASRPWWQRLGPREQEALAQKYIRALSISTPDSAKPIRFLSGGNQQKAILARWLAAQPRLLILDEPTRGIDVGAKAEIERLIAQLCAEGLSILFISSELEELTRVCQRVTVLRDRRLVGELSGDEIEPTNIMRLIAAPTAAADAAAA